MIPAVAWRAGARVCTTRVANRRFNGGHGFRAISVSTSHLATSTSSAYNHQTQLQNEAAKEPFKDAARQANEYMKQGMDHIKQQTGMGMGMGTSDNNSKHSSVVDLIRADHANIGRLYCVYKKEVIPETQLLLGQILIREICIHSNAEEMVVYPLAEQDVSADSANQAREQHMVVEKLLKELDGATKWTQQYDDTLDQAIMALEKHIDYEEGTLMPSLSSRESSARLVELGDAFENARASAPTRPHPMAPKSGLSGMAAKLASKPLDSMRDASRFAGKEPDVAAAKARADTEGETEPTRPDLP